MARTFVIMLCMLMAVFLVAMIAAKPVKADPQLMPNSVVPGFKCEARSSLIKGVESHGGAVAFFRQGGTHYAQAHGPVEGMDGWVYTVTIVENRFEDGRVLWCPVAYQSEHKGIAG